MGAAHRTAARIVSSGYTQGKARAPLAMDTFPVTGMVKTASLNSIVTDSSPGMTAYGRNEANAIFMAGDAAFTLVDSTHFGEFSDPKRSKIAGKVDLNAHVSVADDVVLAGRTAVTGDIDEAGVYINSTSALADDIWEALRRDEDAILREMSAQPHHVGWQPHRHICLIKVNLGDLDDPANEERVLEFFSKTLNLFVSVFRPRLEHIAQELELG